ncbi:hypothetical protein CC1G_10376 [Coprinopsis cinerea okayama7|uniref:Uncharacterized protein n=1 Tax=Coprinopsis cinerea (strain Okayama-7 / 130 / ATCC MYA-4618 / FGSC 9003) TaxID=240176 RepID=A8PEB2_COPC7|nr:hypothetical protein CC1G_10376 [Coprinopsis cinerea okayama7\|eukprot:XP_001840762.1 hypothetical protein CC1G_10376 [Coprinopsis cinerea okayama7\
MGINEGTSAHKRSTRRTALVAHEKISDLYVKNGDLDEHADSQMWFEARAGPSSTTLRTSPKSEIVRTARTRTCPCPERNKELEEEIRELKTRIKALEEEKETMRRECDELRRTVKGCEGAVGDNARGMGLIAEECDELKDRVGNCEEQMQEIKRILLAFSMGLIRAADVEPCSQVLSDGGYLIRRELRHHISNRLPPAQLSQEFESQYFESQPEDTHTDNCLM